MVLLMPTKLINHRVARIVVRAATHVGFVRHSILHGGKTNLQHLLANADALVQRQYEHLAEAQPAAVRVCPEVVQRLKAELQKGWGGQGIPQKEWGRDLTTQNLHGKKNKNRGRCSPRPYTRNTHPKPFNQEYAS